MIVEYLRYTIPNDRQTAFIKAYQEGSKPLLASAYALSFDMCQCVEDATQFILRIEWTSAEDHLQKFRKSEEFREFLTYIKPYIADIDEMRHYKRLEV